MKNDEKPILDEPFLADVARFQTSAEEKVFSDFNQFGNKKSTVREPNEINIWIILLVFVVLAITALILMVTNNLSTALATVN